MTALTLTHDLARNARLAGQFYLVIIVTGLGAELALRAPLIDLGDADATATAILAAPGGQTPPHSGSSRRHFGPARKAEPPIAVQHPRFEMTGLAG